MASKEIRLGAALVVKFDLYFSTYDPLTWHLGIYAGTPTTTATDLVCGELLEWRFFRESPTVHKDALSFIEGQLGLELARNEAARIEQTISNLRADFLREKALSPA